MVIICLAASVGCSEDYPFPDWDSGVPDGLADVMPDIFLVPDGGCPPGYEQCGNECVILSSNERHCGQCFKVCPGNVSDRCVQGKCVCGKNEQGCSNALNCVQGVCGCIKGGLCSGCCDGNICRAAGSGQSVAKCGKGGEACNSCNDGNPCTVDTCLAKGECQHTVQPQGATCDDNVACTH